MEETRRDAAWPLLAHASYYEKLEIVREIAEEVLRAPNAPHLWLESLQRVLAACTEPVA